nr:hypothetical protein [Natrarchaeobaculum aegyptiacum]
MGETKLTPRTDGATRSVEAISRWSFRALPVDDVEKCGGVDNLDSVVRTKIQQMRITGNDVVNIGGDRTLDELVIVSVHHDVEVRFGRDEVGVISVQKEDFGFVIGREVEFRIVEDPVEFVQHRL